MHSAGLSCPLLIFKFHKILSSNGGLIFTQKIRVVPGERVQRDGFWFADLLNAKPEVFTLHEPF